MKKKVKKFLRNNYVVIPIYITLICVGVWDSILALVIYAIIVHTLLLGFIVGLWFLEDVNLPSKSTLRTVIQTLTIVVVLTITEHWYMLCVSLLYIFMAFVYIHDEWKKSSHKTERG